MMEEIDRFQDPTAASISDRDCDTREGETVAMNYKPSPLQVKLEKQRELARKGSLKNGNMGSPVNQQPKKNNVMARTRLVVPNKGYSSLDQSPDEKPLVALDTDSDDDFDMSRYSSSGYSSAELAPSLHCHGTDLPVSCFHSYLWLHSSFSQFCLVLQCWPMWWKSVNFSVTPALQLYACQGHK
ncbi:protein FAM219A isoform X4 [Harpia harpyja]|uniref:protein FAM219A isoform X4 n=1 Tax=Harpia harpyja TaxID=202280 RepID=UPI0022B11459|nr:protein FAM219A isoform X4 [Harpia harpyja]